MLLPRVKEFRKYSNIIIIFFFILSRLNTVTSDHLFTFVINSISICVRCVMGLNTRSFYSERRPKDNNDPETCLALDLLTSLSCTMTVGANLSSGVCAISQDVQEQQAVHQTFSCLWIHPVRALSSQQFYGWYCHLLGWKVSSLLDTVEMWLNKFLHAKKCNFYELFSL